MNECGTVACMRYVWLFLLVVACKKHEQPVPQPAPAMTVDLAKLGGLPMTDRAGGTTQLATALHQVTVLAFWASWCHPCLEELPHVDELARENKDPHVAYVAVNIDDASDRAAALAVLDKEHITLPVLFDPDAAAYQQLFPEAGDDMISVPALAIVRGDRIAYRSDGLPVDPTVLLTEIRGEVARALAH